MVGVNQLLEYCCTSTTELFHGRRGSDQHLEYCCNTELPVSEPASWYCSSTELPVPGGRNEPAIWWQHSHLAIIWQEWQTSLPHCCIYLWGTWWVEWTRWDSSTVPLSYLMGGVNQLLDDSSTTELPDGRSEPAPWWQQYYWATWWEEWTSSLMTALLSGLRGQEMTTNPAKMSCCSRPSRVSSCARDSM